MATKSKKLQTTRTRLFHAKPSPEVHDALIAHEQREVIALLCKALRGPEWAGVALDAAAPFLED